jgi:hypothetical protein
MLLALALTILIDGSPIATSHPARIVAGKTMVPVMPVISRIADAVSLMRSHMLLIERGRRRVSVVIVGDAFCPDCAYVPLAAVVRALGGTLSYDARAKSVALSFSPEVLRTPEPYDMLALPHPSATSLAWPSPPSTTPRPAIAGVPQPRRTPVEVRVPGL